MAGGQDADLQRYAARFAAKEAVLKVLGTGWSGGIAWTDVAVGREGPSGKPARVIQQHGEAAADRGEARHRRALAHVSLSHLQGHALASVIGVGPLLNLNRSSSALLLWGSRVPPRRDLITGDIRWPKRDQTPPYEIMRSTHSATAAPRRRNVLHPIPPAGSSETDNPTPAAAWLGPVVRWAHPRRWSCGYPRVGSPCCRHGGGCCC